jgi:Ser/Thr protein kinase RdoA (MazF antagonist)
LVASYFTHGYSDPWYSYFLFIIENDYEHWISDMFRQSVERFRDNNLEIADELDNIKYSIGESVPTDFDNVLCHNDYSPDNILFENDQVTGIIDFDVAYIGDRNRDIVDGANSFWMHSPNTDWNPRDKFYDGYKHVRKLGNNFWESERFYRFETQVVTVSYLTHLNILTPRQEEFYSNEIMKALRRLNSTTSY